MDNLLANHTFLEMTYDFNNTLIESMINFNDKLNEMHQQGYSENEIALQEGEFWKSIKTAYGRAKSAGSNSRWAGIKAGVKEFGRQIVLIFKKVWIWIKKAYMTIEAYFKKDVTFIEKYEDRLKKAWADKDKKEALSKLKFKVSLPSREVPFTGTDGLISEVNKQLTGWKKIADDLLGGIFSDAQQKNIPELRISGISVIDDPDKVNNLIDAYQKITFNEQKEITVDQFLSGAWSSDWPKGYLEQNKDIFITNYNNDIATLISAFKNDELGSKWRAMVRKSDEILNDLNKIASSTDQVDVSDLNVTPGTNKNKTESAEVAYKVGVIQTKLNKTFAQFILNVISMIHKNQKKCLITCIASLGSLDIKKESAMVLAETFCNASDLEYDNIMNNITSESQIVDNDLIALGNSCQNISVTKESFMDINKLDDVFNTYSI